MRLQYQNEIGTRIVFTMLLFALGCRKTNNTVVSPFFMDAEVDQRHWSFRDDGVVSQISFGVDWIGSPNQYELGIGGLDQDTSIGPRAISLIFGFIPKPGRYSINNVGGVMADSGVMAIYSSNTPYGIFSKWSNSGFVEIDSISKTAISGQFEFTANGSQVDTSTSVIRFGSFLAQYAGGTAENSVLPN